MKKTKDLFRFTLFGRTMHNNIQCIVPNVTCTCIQICGWAAGDVQLEDEEKNKLKLGGGGGCSVQEFMTNSEN